MNEQIIDNIVLYNSLNKEQKKDLILLLQKRRIELVDDSKRRKRNKSFTKKSVKREVPDRILPELRDIFGSLSEECKKLFVR